MADSTVEVNGREVTFKSKYPVKENRKLGKILVDSADGDVDKQIKVLMQVIEAWEYSGRPDDPRSYDDLDYLDDIMPMVAKFGEYFTARIGVDQKN